MNGPATSSWTRSAPGRAGCAPSTGCGCAEVATIPIRSAADLVPTPYTDRTINRHNTWRWKRGRRVYELVAPGGDVYVMQSYSQIRDPRLTLRKLRRLGRRLELPAGWRYRTRRLRRAAHARRERQGHDPPGRPAEHVPAGEGRPARQAQAPAPAARGQDPHRPPDHPRDHRRPRQGQRDSVRPRPGHARRQVPQRPLRGQLQAALPAWLRLGTASLPLTISGDRISFSGRARLTGGTGAFRGIRGRRLRARHQHPRRAVGPAVGRGLGDLLAALD